MSVTNSMLKIGITGGIGTGKSTVASIFKSLNVPILNADALAKDLISTSPKLRDEIINVFGRESFLEDGKYNTTYISKIVFNNADQLSKLNSIVHPYVREFTHNWWMNQEAAKQPYAIKEAAILFESNMHNELDYIIGVDAPTQLRIDRLKNRDNTNEDVILKKMELQMPQDVKMSQCDFVIHNDDRHSLIIQVMELHEKFLKIYCL